MTHDIEDLIRRAQKEWNAQFDTGHVYVVERPDGLVKIGKTGNIDARIRALSLQGGFEPKQIWSSGLIRNAALVERMSHAALSDFRVIGEWFDCSFGAAVAVVDSSMDFEREINQTLKSIHRDSEKFMRDADDFLSDVCSRMKSTRKPNFDALVSPAKSFLSRHLEQIASDLSSMASQIRRAAELLDGQEDSE